MTFYCPPQWKEKGFLFICHPNVSMRVGSLSEKDTMIQGDHVSKRETALGRWLPVSFYSVNFILWIITAIWAGAFNLLRLAILPLPALCLYLLRTRRGSE